MNTPSSIESTSPRKDHFWKIMGGFVLIVICLRLWVIDPFLVNGSSMQPTYKSSDYIIVDKISYQMGEPQRGDVVVFDAPTNDGRYFIKRVIGLPGERVLVNAEEVTIFNTAHPNGFVLNEPYIFFQSDRVADTTLGPNEYFVMGDNRKVSLDSRMWGALKKDAIVGKAFLRLIPVTHMGIYPGSLEEFEGVTYPETEAQPPAEIPAPTETL
jgi:signal peptidase I